MNYFAFTFGVGLVVALDLAALGVYLRAVRERPQPERWWR